MKNLPTGVSIPGSGSPLPIQHVRYLDPDSLVTPNGSQIAPFTDAADFFSDVAEPGGWALMLPAFDAGDFVIPDLNGVPTVLVGVSDTASVIGSIPVAAQGGSEPFPPLTLTLKDLRARNLVFGGGPIQLEADSCFLSQVAASGTITGSVRFVNCRLESTVNFPDADNDYQSCTLGRDDGGACTVVIGTGSFRDCKFLANVTLQIINSLSMYDCSFGNSFKIQCSANQSITCDPVTYGRLVDSAFTVLDTTPTLLQRPVILYQAQIGLLNGAVIPAASVTPFDLGGMSSPSALPGGLAQVSFLGSPNATAACVGAVIDGSGHVIVSVLNTSDVLTTAVENDQEFVVFYQPAELLA